MWTVEEGRLGTMDLKLMKEGENLPSYLPYLELGQGANLVRVAVHGPSDPPGAAH